jgi:hypothetical protein
MNSSLPQPTYRQSRTGRTVEMTVDGDTLTLGRVTHAEQQELTREWLARHPVDPAEPASQQRGYL